MIPYLIETKVATDCWIGRGVHIPNLKIIASAISEIQAAKVWVFCFVFFSFTSFHTLYKIHHKARMCARIGLKFGTLKRLLKVNLSTKFGRNPINIHRVMIDYLRKIRSKVWGWLNSLQDDFFATELSTRLFVSS